MIYPQINRDQFFADFEALRQFGLQPNGAVHRVAYSSADTDAAAGIKPAYSRSI